jgi:hypothetical protein
MKTDASISLSLNRNIEEIEVSAYSGNRADERPVRIIHKGIEFRVTQILEMHLEESWKSRTRKRFFKVVCDDSSIKLIHYNLENNRWYLEAAKND